MHCSVMAPKTKLVQVVVACADHSRPHTHWQAGHLSVCGLGLRPSHHSHFLNSQGKGAAPPHLTQHSRAPAPLPVLDTITLSQTQTARKFDAPQKWRSRPCNSVACTTLACKVAVIHGQENEWTPRLSSVRAESGPLARCRLAVKTAAHGLEQSV